MIVSISHVVVWYSLSNPVWWSIFMSISVEVGAMAALAAATKKIKGGVWWMFGIVTFIQMIGNIFYSYKQIDPNGILFISWVELTSPVWELLGSDVTDIISQKRWLAFLEGGLLPLISLTSLHFFIKYEDGIEENDVKEIIVEKEVPVEVVIEKEVPKEIIKEVIVEKPVEVIKEVIVEKPVEVVKEVYVEKESTDVENEDNEEGKRRLVYTKDT